MKKLFLFLFFCTNFFIFTEICLSLNIPDIIFSFQQPTYLIDKDVNLTTFSCIKGQDCKVNFNLEDSFIPGFLKSNYACEIDFGLKNMTGEENKCNPNTVIFGTGIFDVNFKISEKNNGLNFKNKIIEINNIEEILSQDIILSLTGSNENSGSTNTGNIENYPDVTNLLETDFSVLDFISGSFLSTGSIINITNSGAFLSGVTFIGSGNINIFYGPGNYIFSGVLSDSGFEFINLQEDTTYIYGLDLINNSGIILDFSSGSFKTDYSTGSELSYSGDILEDDNISFGTGEESGSGLYETGILLEIPDIVLDFQTPNYLIAISGSLNEYDCDKTKDECKSNFNLENSFSGEYKENNYLCEISFFSGFITGEENKCNPNTVTFGTGIFDVNFKILDKNDPSNFKEKTIKIYNDNFSLEENLIIPDPIITVQSGLDTNYACLKNYCVINLNAEDSFKDISSNKFSCLWDFGGGTFSSGTENNCNPSYVHYGMGIFDISLKIFEKGNETNFKEIKTTIKNDNVIQNTQFISYVSTNTSETYYPIKAKILLQGVINGKTKKVEGNIFTCITKDKCSINFTAEKNQGKVSYFWDFGDHTTSQNMNPKSVTYKIGEYEVTLKVTDDNGNESQDYFLVKVIDDAEIIEMNEEETIIEKEMVAEKANDINIKSGSKKSKNIQTLSSINPFSINYEIYIQGQVSKDKKIVGNTIYCTTKEICAINFGIKGDKDNKKLNYFWDFGNLQTFSGFNPKTISYSFGKFTTTLNIADSEGNILNTKKYFVVINKIPAKIKSVKKPNTVKKAKEKQDTIKEGIKKSDNNSDISQKLSTEDIVLSGICVSILALLGAYFLIKKYSNIFN